MTLADIVKEATQSMAKAVDSTRHELSGVRSAKASPQLLDTIKVDAYGSKMALNQVAHVSAPEPRMLAVQPFDKSLAAAIEKAIRDGGLGLNPSNQGEVIRVPLPMLSEERRKELVRHCGKLAEEGRISVRRARSEAMALVRKVEGVSDDDKSRSEKEVQRATDDAVAKIDAILKAKEAEVLEV